MPGGRGVSRRSIPDLLEGLGQPETSWVRRRRLRFRSLLADVRIIVDANQGTASERGRFSPGLPGFGQSFLDRTGSERPRVPALILHRLKQLPGVRGQGIGQGLYVIGPAAR